MLESEIEAAVDKLIVEHPTEWQELKKFHNQGKNLVNFIMGQTMKANPTLDPKVVRRLVEEKLI